MKHQILLISGLILLTSCTSGQADLPDGQDILIATKELSSSAVKQAVQKVFDKAKSERISFDNGPCLSNNLFDGWVLDMAHDPRIPEDDLPENQCQKYLDGDASHIVEIDQNGKILNIK